MQKLRVLLLEDSRLDAELTTAALAAGGFDPDVQRVDTRDAFVEALGSERFELILADHSLPNFDGLSALSLARQRRPHVPFIFVSATAGEEIAADAIRCGATDFVLKRRMARLCPSVRRALREAAERLELDRRQRSLRRSEERCRLFVENATDFVFLTVGPAGLIESWSAGAERIFGYPESEAIGQPLAILYTPEDRAAGAPERELELAKTVGRSPDDNWYVRKDGSRFFGSGVTTFMADAGQAGKPAGAHGDASAPTVEGTYAFLKILRDMTERRRQEESLHQSHGQLRLLSETASYLLRHHDSREVIKALFDKLSAHLGLEVYLAYLVDDEARTEREPAPLSLRLLAAASLPADVLARLERADMDGSYCGAVAKLRHRLVIEDVQGRSDPKGNLIRSVGVTCYACYPLIAHGRLIGTLSFGTRARSSFAPEELELMQTVCDQIAMSLDRAALLAREQAANRAKDEFLATVSHELRTPLTAMLGWARLLRGESVDRETLDEGLETIERNAKAQAQLIEDILDISRIISGKLRLNVRPTDLALVVHEALDSVRPAAEAREIRLRVMIEHGPTAGGRSGPAGLVNGDPDRLQQIAWNLLSNAIKFTPRGGEVEVTVDRLESRARVSVSDTGRGISPDFLPYVFDRFRQADASSTRRHGGLGLGLAICRHLIELHGGTIEAHSAGEGRGSTFSFSLPLMPQGQSKPSVRRAAAAPPDVAEATASVPTLGGLKVLVVDDEPDARRLLAAVLERCGASATAVGNVADALRALDGPQRPDIVVSDIGMPDEDGYSLIRHLRSREPERGGAIPVIALTAYTRHIDRVRAMEAGFQLYMTKPVEPAALVSSVAALAVLARREKRKSDAAGGPARGGGGC